MELGGEDLNHLNAPKKITLKILKYPLPPPPKWPQYPYDLVRFHNCPNIMKCDQLPPLSFFSFSNPPLPEIITYIRTVHQNKVSNTRVLEFLLGLCIILNKSCIIFLS